MAKDKNGNAIELGTLVSYKYAPKNKKGHIGVVTGIRALPNKGTTVNINSGARWVGISQIDVLRLDELTGYIVEYLGRHDSLNLSREELYEFSRQIRLMVIGESEAEVG